MVTKYFTPRRATYIILGLSTVVLGLLIWVVLLSNRVTAGEEIRRVEQKAAEADRDQACVYLLALVDVAIGIPMQNLDEILEGGTLTQAERADRRAARERYQKALNTFAPAVKACAQR